MTSREPRPDPLSPHERSRTRLCRLLIYACQGVTATISVSLLLLSERYRRAGGPSEELIVAFGINAALGAVGGAAAVILFWPVARERWLRAAACLLFCPVIHLGTFIAIASTLGCFGLIR